MLKKTFYVKILNKKYAIIYAILSTHPLLLNAVTKIMITLNIKTYTIITKFNIITKSNSKTKYQ